ncbi:MAG: hypothetical protein AB7E79_08535 [Rhodospirillaceae bacterium]
MRFLILTAAFLLAGAGPGHSAAVADHRADVSVAVPAFPKDTGPLVAIDGGHGNYHTIEGRFAPFAKLLSNDGFRVMPITGPFAAEALTGVTILVIANALNPVNATQWSLPTPSAFTSDEIAAVKDFVERGGSLLLIADHMPFAGAAADLAKAFEVTFFNGFAFRMPEPRTVDFFLQADGTLGHDLITLGRTAQSNVSRIGTFAGSAFRAPETARKLLILPNDFQVIMPQTAWVFTPETPRVPGGGMLQGAALLRGRGRLAVFGEAGMFTAQVDDADPNVRLGFTVPGAEHNKQFVLNISHWLAGLLGP